MILFNADNIEGQAPPYKGNGEKRGSHLWYLSILPYGSKITAMEFVDYNANNSEQIRIGIDEQVYCVFNLKGELLDIRNTDLYSGKEYEFIIHQVFNFYIA